MHEEQHANEVMASRAPGSRTLPMQRAPDELTTREAAGVLGCSQRVVRRAVASGALPAVKRGAESGLSEKPGELGRGPVLGNRFEFLEGGSESVTEAPEGSRPEILVLRIEVAVVNYAVKVMGNFQSAFNERRIDHELG